MFGFADFAADFARAPFHRALSLHAPVADHTAGLLFDLTFEFSCASARPVSTTRFHSKAISAAQNLVAMGF